MLRVIRKIFDFGDWARSHPTEPPPGDMLDAQFFEIIDQIDRWEERVAQSIRHDGKIAAEAVLATSLEPGLIDKLAAESAGKVREAVDRANSTAILADNARLAAENALTEAKSALQSSALTNRLVEDTKDAVLTSASAAIHRADAAATRAEQFSDNLGNMAQDGLAANENAKVWADVSYHWAEYIGPGYDSMDQTIPAYIADWLGITGDHWSSRWWANYAARAAQAKTLVRGSSARYLYFASADQTVFTGLDHYNQALTVDWDTNAAEVYVNGSLLTPDFDYKTVNDNQLELLVPVPADTVVEVIVTKPFTTGLQALIETRKKLDTSTWVINGVSTSFPLIDKANGTAIAIATADVHDIVVDVNGVTQNPGVDFTVAVDRIQFAVAPEIDARIWGTAYDDPPDTKSGGGWVELTQAQYDALNPKDPNTLYVVVG